MANKNDRMAVAHYPSEAAAADAAAALKKWDKANSDIKLGAIAVVTLDPKKDKLEVKEVGQRKTRSGALWGTAVGAAAGLMTGGLALIPAALMGAGGGGALGAMFHKKVGISDAERDALTANLRAGGAVLVVMVDDFEVEATKAELARSGGKVESYEVPAETAEAITTAAADQAEAVSAVDDAVDAWAEEPAAETAEATAPEGAAAQADAIESEEDAVAAVAEGHAETERAVAQEMPELSPEDTAAVAKIVAATYLSSEDASKLHAAGVDKASTLLGMAATPQGRQELADSTGLSSATILAGVKKMDLMRIKGVGVKHGALLLAAGVDTVPELAQRNPTNLYASLAAANEDKHIVADLPKEAEVADWVSRAKEAPRIITY